MSQTPRSHRGCVLTEAGMVKLESAIAAAEADEREGRRFSQTEISDRAKGLNEKTTRKIRKGQQPAYKGSIELLFGAFGLTLTSADFGYVDSPAAEISTLATLPQEPRRDWIEAPDAPVFFGRQVELAQLEQWVLVDNCRMVALLGMGGMGKTALTVTLAKQIEHHFDYVIWRSLREAPPMGKILADCIQFFSDQQDLDVPDSVSEAANKLIHYLQTHRCLLILDNAESIMAGGKQAGCYQNEYEDYGILLRRIGESQHKSCVLLTSREKPKEIATLEGHHRPVRSFSVQGLEVTAGRAIFDAEEIFTKEEYYQTILERYQGNPLALTIAANCIQNLYGGNVVDFLANGSFVFSDIHDLLEEQFDRLSSHGRCAMYWLAVNREPIKLMELQEDWLEPISIHELQCALESLSRRSLIERTTGGFTLQNVVMEYVTERFVKKVSEEIHDNTIDVFSSHLLLKTTSNSYTKKTQINLILKPILRFLESQAFEPKVLLKELRKNDFLVNGYAPGNIINILSISNLYKIEDLDFSRLTIRHAFLKNSEVKNSSFKDSSFILCEFKDSFASTFDASLNPIKDELAICDGRGDIYIINTKSKELNCKYSGHTSWVSTVEYSPDGSKIASGSADCTIRIWNREDDSCTFKLIGHKDRIWSLAFSPDGLKLASSSGDGTIRIWDVESGRCIHKKICCEGIVWSVAFSSDGNTIASASGDSIIRLWDINSNVCRHELKLAEVEDIDPASNINSKALSVTFHPEQNNILASGYSDGLICFWDIERASCTSFIKHEGMSSIWTLKYDQSGNALASSGDDKIIRLWKIESGQYILLKSLRKHDQGNRVWSLNFDRDRKTLISIGDNGVICFWDIEKSTCTKVIRGNSKSAFGLSVHPQQDSNLIYFATAHEDKAVRIWSTGSNACIGEIVDHGSRVWDVKFSLRGDLLASSDETGEIRIYKIQEISNPIHLKTFKGHKNRVLSLEFSPDGRKLVSACSDGDIFLWNIETEEPCHWPEAHSHWIWTVRFSPCGNFLASCSSDKHIKVWNVNSQELLHDFREHKKGINSIVFNPLEHFLVSGDDDGRIFIFDYINGSNVDILSAHKSRINCLDFSRSGDILASAGDDAKILIWDFTDRQKTHTLAGHEFDIRSIKFSPDGKYLFSCSGDQTIRTWDVKLGQCIQVMKVPGPYEGMDITAARGLTQAQRSSLIVLGAVDNLT